MPGFEDYAVGQIVRYGNYAVTREEVLAFARAYDPQPFHTEDDAAAANPIFGRLSASGWHTASMTMRMMVDDGFAIGGGAGLGSPGLDELLWLKPVYPGDTLHCETEVLEVRPSSRKPHLGAVKSRTTVYNQHDEKVMQQVATVLVRRREG